MQSTDSLPNREHQALQLYTVPEVAGILRVTKMTVYRKIAAGELTTVDIGTGRARTRIRRADLLAYIERNTRDRA